MRNERVIIITDTHDNTMMAYSSLKYVQKRFPEWKTKMWKIGEEIRENGESKVEDRYVVKRLNVNASS